MRTSQRSQKQSEERCHSREQQRQRPHHGGRNHDIRGHFPRAREPSPGDGRVRGDHRGSRLIERAGDRPRESRAAPVADFRAAPPSPSHRARDLACSRPLGAFFFVIVLISNPSSAAGEGQSKTEQGSARERIVAQRTLPSASHRVIGSAESTARRARNIPDRQGRTTPAGDVHPAARGSEARSQWRR